MTRKYRNRSLISETGMSFSIKTAAAEFSPYNQTPWQFPPRLLQLRLPRSFPLLYCSQMLLDLSSPGSCVAATSTGDVALSEQAARRQPSLSRAQLQPQNQNPSLLLCRSKPRQLWLDSHPPRHQASGGEAANEGAGRSDTYQESSCCCPHCCPWAF